MTTIPAPRPGRARTAVPTCVLVSAALTPVVVLIGRAFRAAPPTGAMTVASSTDRRVRPPRWWTGLTAVLFAVPFTQHLLRAGVVGSMSKMGQDAGTDVIDRAAPVVVETVTTLDATPAEVWRVLADAARWPEWNGFIGSAALEGPLAAGSTTTWTVGNRNIRSRLTAGDLERGLDRDSLDSDIKGLHGWQLVPDGEGTRVTNVESPGDGSADAQPEAITEQLTWFLDAWASQLKAEVEG